MARLQPQDHPLGEAALDLGAARVQAFRRITLPFLKPTIVSAAVIAFLQSFKTTTAFSIGDDHAPMTEFGARMRFGISPIISAITVIYAVRGFMRQREAAA